MRRTGESGIFVRNSGNSTGDPSGTAGFRHELESRLKATKDRVLLRVLLGGDTPPVELTGADLLNRATRLAQDCCTAPPGSVVLILLPHSAELFLLHLGLILTRRVPAILAWPTSRIDPEKYQRNLLHQLQHLPAEQLVTLPNLAANIGSGLPYPVTTVAIEAAQRWEDAFSIPLQVQHTPGHDRHPDTEKDLSDALFLQFSGGTTGAQKAVVVTGAILSEQLARLKIALNFTAQDTVVSWLPMYHDMGLIACLWLPLWDRATSVQFAASDWLLNPSLLFELMELYNGTFCWLPNFAFSYLAAQRGRMRSKPSLKNVRAWINCSEPVRLRSLMEFVQAYSDLGVTKQSLQASYAMAENVFAVTQTVLEKELKTFPRSSITNVGKTPQLAFDLLDEVYVSSGTPLSDMDVRIVKDGALCKEAQSGEIQIKTPSLFRGYWGSDGYRTSSFTSDGWYSTGDYGFMAGGQLFVIGRLKDIVIVGGQNVFPEDVELIVNTVVSVYPGRVVAFGVMDAENGTESLCIIAELRGNYDRALAEPLEREIHKLILTTIGIAPRRVVVVPERWIVKSTAGKISRRETRERFIRDLLPQPLPWNNTCRMSTDDVGH